MLGSCDRMTYRLRWKARHLGAEGPGQATVELEEAVLVEDGALGDRRGDAAPDVLARSAASAAEHVVGEERVGVVDRPLGLARRRSCSSHVGGAVERRGGLLDLVDRRGVGRRRPGARGRRAPLRPRHGARAGASVIWPGRAMASVEELLVGWASVGSGGSSISSTMRWNGYSCSAAERSVWRMTRASSLYDGHEHREGRHRAAEVVVDGRAGGPAVGAGPDEEPVPGDEVRHRRAGQQGHHEQVGHGLAGEAHALRAVVDELPDDRGDDVGDPGGHRDHHRQPAGGEGPVRGRARVGRERRDAPVGAPLPPAAARLRRNLGSSGRALAQQAILLGAGWGAASCRWSRTTPCPSAGSPDRGGLGATR